MLIEDQNILIADSYDVSWPNPKKKNNPPVYFSFYIYIHT